MNLPNMPDSNPSDHSNYTKIKAQMTIVFGGEEQDGLNLRYYQMVRDVFYNFMPIGV